MRYNYAIPAHARTPVLRTKAVTALAQQNTMNNEEEYLFTNKTSVTRSDLIMNAWLLQYSNSWTVLNDALW